jgi:hypothetical protein
MNIKKIIREEVEDFQWVKDIPEFSGTIIDTNESPMTTREILTLLHDYGYKWGTGTPILDSNGKSLFGTFRYIMVGPLVINDYETTIHENTIMHDSVLPNKVNGQNVKNFVITL